MGGERGGAVESYPASDESLVTKTWDQCSQGETTELLCRAVSSVSRQKKKQPTRNHLKETCHQEGEAERGGRPKHHTPHTTNHTEEERRGARRQQRTEGERDTHAPEGVRMCLSGVQKGAKDHTMMNTSVREHTAPQQHRKHGVEGKIPTQGQRPLLPWDTMQRGDNAPQHSTHRDKATRPSPEATIPRGRDQ